MKNKANEGQKLNSIKSWSEDDRPREKLIRLGPKTLSDAELLAIIIQSGTVEESAVDVARRILSDNNNELNLLAHRSINDLKKYKGIGEAKAVSIVAAMELVNRKTFEKKSNRSITSSRDVYEDMYQLLVDNLQEEFWVLLLNNKNLVIARKCISQGGVSKTIVDLKLIFRFALENTASGIIVVHNHPSGSTTPSEEDIRLTTKIKNASSFFDIQLLDHVIFAGSNYYSFADEGKI